MYIGGYINPVQMELSLDVLHAEVCDPVGLLEASCRPAMTSKGLQSDGLEGPSMCGVCVCVCVGLFVFVRVYLHIYIYIYTHTYVDVYMYVYMLACMRASNACIYVCKYIYILLFGLVVWNYGVYTSPPWAG